MNTLFIGRYLSRLDRVDSTNNYAFELLKRSDLPDGSVIWADEQWQGKGQRGNEWFSTPYTNLTMSVVLKPRFLEAEEYFYLTKVVTLAIVSYLESLNLQDVKIKWPNDIYIGDKKVAGLLIENQLKGSRINLSVLGIGLNLNEMIFPAHLPKATSVKRETGKHQSIELVMERLCEEIEANYLRLKSNLQDLDRVFETYLWGMNKWRTFLLNGQPIELMISGVSSQGRLMVKGRDGELRKYDFRQLSFML